MGIDKIKQPESNDQKKARDFLDALKAPKEVIKTAANTGNEIFYRQTMENVRGLDEQEIKSIISAYLDNTNLSSNEKIYVEIKLIEILRKQKLSTDLLNNKIFMKKLLAAGAKEILKERADDKTAEADAENFDADKKILKKTPEQKNKENGPLIDEDIKELAFKLIKDINIDPADKRVIEKILIKKLKDKELSAGQANEDRFVDYQILVAGIIDKFNEEKSLPLNADEISSYSNEILYLTKAGVELNGDELNVEEENYIKEIINQKLNEIKLSGKDKKNRIFLGKMVREAINNYDNYAAEKLGEKLLAEKEARVKSEKIDSENSAQEKTEVPPKIMTEEKTEETEPRKEEGREENIEQEMTSGQEKTPEEDNTSESKVEVEQIEEELKNMPEEKRIKVGFGLRNIGLHIEEKKNKFFAKAFGGAIKLANKVKLADDKGTANRFFKSLRENFEKDAVGARKKMEDIKEGKILRNQLSNSGYLLGNILKYGRTVTDVIDYTAGSPLKYIMMGSMAFARGAGAAKEARFKNEELINKTRIQEDEIERAAEEAWNIYEEAKKGKEEISIKDLDRAYQKNIPQNILERLTKSSESGTASSLIKKIIYKDVESSVKKIHQKISDIYSDKNMPEKEKIEKEKEILNKYEKHLKDLDRTVTQYGTIDALAMGAKYLESAGKAAVYGMMAQTLALSIQRAWEDIPKILADIKESKISSSIIGAKILELKERFLGAEVDKISQQEAPTGATAAVEEKPETNGEGIKFEYKPEKAEYKLNYSNNKITAETTEPPAPIETAVVEPAAPEAPAIKVEAGGLNKTDTLSEAVEKYLKQNGVDNETKNNFIKHWLGKKIEVNDENRNELLSKAIRKFSIANIKMGDGDDIKNLVYEGNTVRLNSDGTVEVLKGDGIYKAQEVSKDTLRQNAEALKPKVEPAGEKIVAENKEAIIPETAKAAPPENLPEKKQAAHTSFEQTAQAEAELKMGEKIENIYKWKFGPFKGSQIEEWDVMRGKSAEDILNGNFGEPLGNEGMYIAEMHNREELQNYITEAKKFIGEPKEKETIQEFVRRYETKVIHDAHELDSKIVKLGTENKIDKIDYIPADKRANIFADYRKTIGGLNNAEKAYLIKVLHDPNDGEALSKIIGEVNGKIFEGTKASLNDKGDLIVNFDVKNNLDDVKLIITKNGKIAVDGYFKNNWPDGVDVKNPTTNFNNKNLKKAMSFLNGGEFWNELNGRINNVDVIKGEDIVVEEAPADTISADQIETKTKK